MSTTIDNLRTGRARRAATFVLPALFVLLGASGVTVRPLVLTGDLSTAIEAARTRAHACASARERWTRFESSGGAAALDHAWNEVRGVLPEDLHPVDVHTLVTLCARRRGLELETVALAAPRAADVPEIADRVVDQPVDLKGEGALSGVAQFVEDLRAAGLPTSVVEFSLTRTELASPRFDFRITLALHQRAAAGPQPTAATTEGSP